MYDIETTVTSTPSYSTQKQLRFGAVRDSAKIFGTALIMGSATFGPARGPSEWMDSESKLPVPSNTLDQVDYPVLCVPEFVTDHELPAELQTYLESHLRPIAVPDGSTADDILPQRLTPPPMEERIVRARLRFTGEDTPRIWFDGEMDY